MELEISFTIARFSAAPCSTKHYTTKCGA